MNWYYSDGDQQRGPISEEQLIELRRAGTVTADSLVWREGMVNWAAYREAGPATNPDAGPQPAAPPRISTQFQTGPAEAVCIECGRIFPKDEMIAHQQSYVCAGCKPVFVQKLAEGAQTFGMGFTPALPYAGFWIRAGAKIIDGIILSVVLYVPLFIIMAARGGDFAEAMEPGNEFGAFDVMILVWQLAFYLFYAAYDIFFIGKYGATPGKMACRIHVVTAEGARFGYGRATGRFFANLLSGMICYIGYIIAAFDDQKRALHDHICNTRVIRK